MPARALILPGLYDSGPQHWQTLWEGADSSFVRVVQDDWERPVRAEWVARLEEAVARHGPGVVLVAHSTSCALVAFWSRTTSRTVRGALLVAPSDTEAPSYPEGPSGWTPMPSDPIPFPTIVVASSDDEYVSPQRARHFASRWGSRFVGAGPAGHLNSASGLGDWPAGRRLLDELL